MRFDRNLALYGIYFFIQWIFRRVIVARMPPCIQDIVNKAYLFFQIVVIAEVALFVSALNCPQDIVRSLQERAFLGLLNENPYGTGVLLVPFCFEPLDCDIRKEYYA